MVIYEKFEAAPKAIAIDVDGAIHIIAGRGTSSSKKVGYEAFVSLSVPMYGMSPRANEECLKKLPEYLNMSG